ncbi:MAG: EscU/YscU/HrcU family type III secretion system export apparatus switch protein [Gammaproteobacteria bacterium]|jgi:flagellar biosynthesis protein|nr:EscU/YscU/HrcU family type III secretion system export apparatus switch protein [Gammaproteobacteria bacterium]
MIKKPSPPKSAVALRYDGTGAPRVTAQGQGYVAEQILALADEHNVPLHKDANLVRLLSQLELGEEIPASLYAAVAEVLSFVYLLSGRLPQHMERDEQEKT